MHNELMKEKSGWLPVCSLGIPEESARSLGLFPLHHLLTFPQDDHHPRLMTTPKILTFNPPFLDLIIIVVTVTITNIMVHNKTASISHCEVHSHFENI